MIKEILKLDNNIQYSINIDLDYKDESKKQSYILTSKSVDIINEIVSTFDNKNKNKSKILIGPYGKGKSHLALYIMGLVSNNRSDEKYNLLLDKSKEQGEDVYENIKEFIASDKKYLPVVLNSTPYNKNFSDILIYSLKNALDINDINDISLDFYFEKAVDKIEVWEGGYKSTFELFKSKLNEDVEVFKNNLRDYNKTSYEIFKQIYKELMAGDEFNPYFEISPVKIYEDASNKLKEKGYNGIFVLYDEFSKYIEHLIAQNSILDIKMMQDFAEFCNRSIGQEVHMLFISHKAMAQYTDKASKNSIDAWKAIEGRFDEIQYNDFSNQQYEIISSAIKKDNALWETFKNKNKVKFEKLQENYSLRTLFKELSDSEYQQWILYGAYPMHPLSTYVLPRISERVAQNERTLFSFLCKNETNSLTDYIIKNNVEVKLDAIYDYFEDNIMSLGYNDEVNKILLKSNNILEQLSSKLEKDIVKSIAIIHMVNNFNIIKPNYTIIDTLYGEEGLNTLKSLVKNNYLIYRSLNDLLDISTDKDIEVLSEIRNAKENNSNINIIEFLNNNFKNIFAEPRRYNDENCIIRYFKVKFANENIDTTYIREDIKNEKSDGIIYITENIPGNIDNNLDVLFIKNKIDENTEDEIKYLYTIKKLKSNKNTDKSIKSELDCLESNYENAISNYIYDLINLEIQNDVVYNNKLVEIDSKKDLSKLLSDIMGNTFSKTPIINNEMINKSNPSKVVIGARKKIIDQILELNKNNIVFRKGSLESTILRSVLLLNKAVVATENEGEYKADYTIFENTAESNFSELLKKIDKLIKKSIDEEIKITEIYNVFESMEYQYGMRKGPIPIVLSFVFSKHKKYLSILENGREIILNSNTIEDIDLKPENYAIKLQNINDERELYISQLENIFIDYININEIKNDNLTYLTLGIKKWFLYLSKYTKDTKKVYLGNKKSKKLPKDIVIFKNKLRILNENSIRFLFEDMVGIFEVGSYEKLIQKISEAKENIDKYKENLYKCVSCDVKKIFEINQNASLNNGLYQWIEGVEKSVAFKNGFIGGFINFIENNKELNDSNTYLDKLSNYVLGLHVADWNDETPNIFIDKINDLKEDIYNFSTEIKSSYTNNNSIEIAITEEIDLGVRASMLLDDLKDTLEDYGSSVTEDEKRSILIELLKEIK
ncbi:hypothetical protein QOZ83_01160 [Romboutsia sedimentorum]|uniref:hypothetical protein n=1 Tax=Romboutsia sedimentorum TaxID=1368474 RepID=UPI0024DEFD1C|nr:hypothetical protein [Romboutsia sedimentorum]MDK2584454.1 hypothetical protein [Romboutsia sedimentorum]